MRPLLRPGTHLLRRGDGSIQLGIDPARAIVLTDSPAVRSCVEGLDGSARRPADDALLGLLDEQSMVVDESVLMPLIGADSARSSGTTRATGGALPRATGAALVRTAGPRAAEAATARRRARVHLTGFGHPDGADLVGDLDALLGRSGLRTRVPRSDHVAGAAPVLGALVGVGEPDRGLLDGWMRHSTPFVLVRVTEGRATVGPFVQPGATACLRCIDAHHTDADASWPLLVQQYARASARDRADGVPEPVDPALAAIALAWAARDLASYADGLRPSTWSATVTLDEQVVEMATRTWLRHPDCGCWWDASS